MYASYVREINKMDTYRRSLTRNFKGFSHFQVGLGGGGGGGVELPVY